MAYKATAGTIFLKDDDGKPNASIFYIAYTRSDVKDFSRRLLACLYNGRPGSSSVWIHRGAFGPRRADTPTPSPLPRRPTHVVDNGESLIDVADLVFIDPVGTGFSNAVGKAKDQDFWGIEQDVNSLAQFITAYVSRNNGWNSPKFLIGESYGTFRNAALVNYLPWHAGDDVHPFWTSAPLSFFPSGGRPALHPLLAQLGGHGVPPQAAPRPSR